MKRISYSYLTLGILLFSRTAEAIPLDSGDMLNHILDSFKSVASTWQSKITLSASWLFWGLALISMVCTYTAMILRNADIQAFFAETIRFFGTLGFFWWLLKNGPAISISIIDTMRAISANASGLGSGLSPSSIVDIGFNILTKVSSTSSVLSPVVSALMIITAIVVLVILSLIAVNMLLLLVSAWLMAYAGVFLLGFGGSRWSSDIAINFYRTVLGIGVQLFTITFLVGVGKSFLDPYYRAFQSGSPDLNSLCVLLIAAVVLLSLVNKLPPMMAGIIGAGSQSSGIGSFGAGAAIGAAAMAASAAASAGNAVLAGANEIVGGTSALNAAFKAAQADMESSSGDTGNLDFRSNGEQQLTGGIGESAFMQAMGTSSSNPYVSYATRLGSTGRAIAGAGSVLAGHIARDVGERASATIADTVGGRFAAAIESHKEHVEGRPNFGGDNLSAGDDEISNFVNKKPPQD